MFADQDFTLCAEYLHPESETANPLPAGHRLAALALCDGLGQMTAEELEAKGASFHYAHVMESSEEAISKSAAYIRERIKPKPAV